MDAFIHAALSTALIVGACYLSASVERRKTKEVMRIVNRLYSMKATADIAERQAVEAVLLLRGQLKQAITFGLNRISNGDERKALENELINALQATDHYETN